MNFPHPKVIRSIDALPGKQILAVAPHPDDETISFGGALALHANRGDCVKIIIATDGKMGDYGNRFDPFFYTSLREQECKRATSFLHVSDVEFWREHDGNLSNIKTFIPRLIEKIENYKPDTIYFPSAFEFHPDHLAVTEGVIQAVTKTHLNPILLMGEIIELMICNLLIVVDPVYEQKKRALKCYTSQLKYMDFDNMNRAINHARTANFVQDFRYVEAFIQTNKKEAKKINQQIYSFRQKILESVNEL